MSHSAPIRAEIHRLDESNSLPPQLEVIPRNGMLRLEAHPAPVPATSGTGGIVGAVRTMTAAVLVSHLLLRGAEMGVGLFGRDIFEHHRTPLEHGALKLREA